MHTKDNHPVVLGDKLWLPVTVISCAGGEEYCNVTVESVEPMFPGTNVTSVTLNTKQLYHVPPLVVSFDFNKIIDFGQKAINVLKVAGDSGIDALRDSFEMFKAITGRDMDGVFKALNDVKRDVTVIIDAIKVEFQLE